MLDTGVPDLRQVLDVLGSALLRPLTELPDRPVPVSGVLIFERRAPLPLPPVRDAILLAVGVGAAEAQAKELIDAATEAGYACVVVKSFGEPVTDLVDAAQRSGLVLLAADEAVAWHHLDAMVSSALAPTVRFAQAAGTPAVGDLFALANAIAGMVGGATVIEDPHRRILAYSTLPGQAVDEGRSQGILGLQVPEGPEYDEQYRVLTQARHTCRFAAFPGGLPRLGVAVRVGSEVLGSIWVVDADGHLDVTAEQALSDVADIVSLHLLAARTAVDAVRGRRADLFRRLLAHPSSVSAVVPQLGLDPNLPVAVAAFAVASIDAEDVLTAHTANRLADLVSLHCEARYGRHGCALIDGTVYALLPSGPSPNGPSPNGPSPSGPSANSHRELVADIARRAHGALRVRVRAGLGSLVPGLGSIASSRADADLVLRALTDRPGDPEWCQVATIDEVWASATLSALAHILATHEVLPRSIGPAIRAHDLKHGTTYASTLLAYLDANSDVVTASNQLSVHPNTIRYRLARAEEIFGFDFTDPDERLVLWLRLRLGDQLGW
ncbi:PucR family transcriptional regulator [Streptomyces lasiicapitis]|uniref:PucR family transcriptional regulator n=1 Tax=Streptomyces lasiicapitis TaxID=1923961 RepID=UPI0036CF4A86